MIHIATVHWKTEKWIDVQRYYLQKHIQSPFRVYAWLNDLPSKYRNAFFYTCTESVTSHASKLNILADIICFAAHEEDDIIIFLDGDAFPINDIEPLITQKLDTYRLIAIQRIENNGDIQPHPSFCVTTAKFWKSINGDWNRGYKWENSDGKLVTDVGGNLLKTLEENKIDWYPLLRSNRYNMHPLFFGIYGDLIYHHGAGFRDAWSRIDVAQSKNPLQKKAMDIHLWKLQQGNGLFPKVIHKAFLSSSWIFNKLSIRQNNLLKDEVFAKIQSNKLFYKEFL